MSVATAEPVLDPAREDPVSVTRAFEELEPLRDRWRSFPLRRVDADIDFFSEYAHGSAAVVRPHVISLAGGLVVARLEHTVLTTTVGYKAVYRPRIRLLVVAHGGITGADSEELSRASVTELMATLRRGEADAVLLPSVRTDSPLFAAARALPPALCRQRPLVRTTHWRLELPDSMETFMQSRSKKVRENARVYGNRLRREFGDRLTVEKLSSPGDVDRIFAELGEVAAMTYQGGLGVGFEDTAARRATTTLGLERGWFRAYLLYLDGRPIAFWQGYAYGRTFFTGTPGYDPAFANLSVGTFLLLRVIEDLCSDEGVDELDYGFGDADYKRRFGSESWEEADVLIFAPRLKGLRVNLARTAILGGAQAARSVLERTGLAGSLKKRWRRRLSRSR